MRETILYGAVMIAVLLAIWGLGWLVAQRMEVVEVIEPEPGIHCAVVSRMMNTSIDCWQVQDDS